VRIRPDTGIEGRTDHWGNPDSQGNRVTNYLGEVFWMRHQTFSRSSHILTYISLH
jgi:hypothetical protein